MMKKIFFSVCIVMLISSCNSFTEKHYQSTDQTTGGFTDIRLDLNANKTLHFTKINMIEVSQNEGGTVYEPETLSVAGTWRVNNGLIKCTFKEEAGFVAEAFTVSRFKTKGLIREDNSIIFPENTDTIYILGHPCIATDTIGN